jgi:polysaccharide export outer membrane protein
MEMERPAMTDINSIRPYTAGALVCAAFLLAGPDLMSQALTPPAPAGATGPELRSTYVLGPEDQISIHATDLPDASDKQLRVDLKGEISVPMVGRIQASGLTPQQLEAELTERLKVYLKEPEVFVTVTEFRSQPISVVGEVGTPGIQQLQGRRTLLDIISLAGGVRSDAGPTIRIMRELEWGRIPLPGAADDPSGKFNIADVDLKSLMDATNPEKNITLRPYDVISVPRAEVVYVMGEVGKAGPLPLGDGHSISALTALSSSGGVLRTAAADRAMILRPTVGAPRRATIGVDLKKIIKGQANDVALLPGDILFVPDSTGKRATARAIEAFIQMGTILGTYGAIH